MRGALVGDTLAGLMSVISGRAVQDGSAQSKQTLLVQDIKGSQCRRQKGLHYMRKTCNKRVGCCDEWKFSVVRYLVQRRSVILLDLFQTIYEFHAAEEQGVSFEK